MRVSFSIWERENYNIENNLLDVFEHSTCSDSTAAIQNTANYIYAAHERGKITVHKTGLHTLRHTTLITNLKYYCIGSHLCRMQPRIYPTHSLFCNDIVIVNVIFRNYNNKYYTLMSRMDIQCWEWHTSVNM